MGKESPVGLIGVGLLGAALAERLLESGEVVVGHDVAPGRLEVLTAAGGISRPSAADVLAECEVTFLSLPTSDIVARLLHSEAEALAPGKTLIDTTTGDPQQMIGTASRLRANHVDYVEATVAGSSAQLREGLAALFVGGEEAAVRRVQPLLDRLADRHWRLGPVGAASRFKLVHNLILGLHRAALAEGLTFARHLGFDPAAALEVLLQTPAASAAMAAKGAKMVTGQFEPQARLSQHLKDVRLIVALARDVGAATPLSEAHAELLARAEAFGYGDADNSAVIRAYEAPPEGADPSER